MRKISIQWLPGLCAVLFVVLPPGMARADYLYVWSSDGSIAQYTAPNTDTIIANTGSDFNGPVGLAVDNQGYLYSGNPSNSTITQYAANGSTPLGEIDSISGLAYNSSSGLCGTFPNYNEVGLGLIPATGNALVNIYGSTVNDPATIAFNSSGDVFVANSGSNTIEEFSPTGADLGAYASGLLEPFGLAFDSSGNLFG